MTDAGPHSARRESTVERRPNLHRRGLLALAALVVVWKLYVVLASSFAVRQLQNLAARADVRIDRVDARSWYPGYLVIRNLVVHHTWQGQRCRTTATEIDLPHDASRAVFGDLRVEALAAEGVRLACGAQPEPPPRLMPAPSHMGMLVLAKFATATREGRAEGASLTAERVTIRVDSVSLGQARLLTPFEVHAEGLRVSGDGRVDIVRASAQLESATMTWERRPMLDDLRASVQVTASPGESEPNWASRFRTTLVVPSARVQALPLLQDDARSTVRGMLRLELAWHGAELAPQSSLHLSLDPFALKHGDSGRVRFASTSSVEAVVLPANGTRQQRVQWQVSSPWLQYQQAKELTASASTLRLRLETEPNALLPSASSEFSLTARAVQLRRHELTLEAEAGALDGRLAGAGTPRLLDTAHLSLSGTKLHSDRVPHELDPKDTPQADAVERRFSVRVTINAAPSGYSGAVNLQGGDAGVVLTLTQTRGLPNWIVSKFEAQPFTLGANVRVVNETVQLWDVILERGALQLTGWWQLVPRHDVGALLMRYGGLAIGIDEGRSGPRVVLSPPPDWLQSKTPAPLR